MLTQVKYNNSILLSSSELFFPIRLIILQSLFKQRTISFVELQRKAITSSGNLVGHLRILERDNLITFKKEFRNNKPRTTYSLTEKGIEEFVKLRERLLEFLK